MYNQCIILIFLDLFKSVNQSVIKEISIKVIMSKLIQRLTSNNSNKIQHFDIEQHSLTLKEINWGFKAERKKYLIDPTAKIKQIWNYFIIFLVFYVSIILPFELGFGIPQKRWYIIIGYSIDILFTIDMFLNFVVTYQDPETHFFVNNYKKVFLKYLKGWFIIDFLSIFPFELIINNKLLKSIRLLRINKLLKKMANKNNSTGFCLRLIWMIILFCLVIHWIACLFAILTNIFQDNYILAFYWSSMTLTTVGYGDITPINDIQRLINSIVMIFGSLIYAVIFGNISLYISSISNHETKYQESVNTLINYMNDISLPLKLKNKVLKYHNYVWQKNRGQNDKNKLGHIPQRVKVEVATLTHGRMIKLNPIFAQAPQSFINSASLSLSFTVCLPNEYVFQQGEIAKNIYFIGRGQVGVFNNKYGTITVLSTSSFFGEIPLFCNQNGMFRIHSIRGYAYCDLWKMDFQTFYQLINSHPKLKTIVINVAKERLKKQKFYNDEVMLDKLARKMRSSLKRRQSKLIDDIVDDEEQEQQQQQEHEQTQSLKILSRIENHIQDINDKINSINRTMTSINYMT